MGQCVDVFSTSHLKEIQVIYYRKSPNLGPRVWKCSAWSGPSHTSWGSDWRV